MSVLEGGAGDGATGMAATEDDYDREDSFLADSGESALPRFDYLFCHQKGPPEGGHDWEGWLLAESARHGSPCSLSSVHGYADAVDSAPTQEPHVECKRSPPLLVSLPAAPKAYRGTKGRRGGFGGFSAFDLPQPQDAIQPGATEMGACCAAAQLALCGKLRCNVAALLAAGGERARAEECLAVHGSSMNNRQSSLGL